MPYDSVTIGIPTYNEARFIESTIRSAATQCETLLLSDNASTDDTTAIMEDICREYAGAKSWRQKTNMGAHVNFKFLLDQVSTPYFMWLGGHDLIPDGYVAKLRQALQDNPDAVLAYGSSKHIAVDGSEVVHYEYPFNKLVAEKLSSVRIMGLIRHLDDCSLIHGLFRTEALKRAWPSEKYLGGDHVLLTMVALEGRLIYVPETHLLRRDVHLHDTNEAQLVRITGNPGNRIRPDYKFMQQKQYECAARAPGKKSITKLLYLLNVRYRLAARFGPFSDNPGLYLIEAIPYFFNSWFKRLANFLSSR